MCQVVSLGLEAYVRAGGFTTDAVLFAQPVKVRSLFVGWAIHDAAQLPVVLLDVVDGLEGLGEQGVVVGGGVQGELRDRCWGQQVLDVRATVDVEEVAEGLVEQEGALDLAVERVAGDVGVARATLWSRSRLGVGSFSQTSRTVGPS